MADKPTKWYPHPGLDQSLVNQIAFQNLYSLRDSTPQTVAPPSGSSDPGSEGQISFDANYMYVYSGGSWRRSPLGTF